MGRSQLELHLWFPGDTGHELGCPCTLKSYFLLASSLPPQEGLSSCPPGYFPLRIAPLWAHLKVWCRFFCSVPGAPQHKTHLSCVVLWLGSWHWVRVDLWSQMPGFCLVLEGEGPAAAIWPEEGRGCLGLAALDAASHIRKHCVLLARFITLSLQQCYKCKMSLCFKRGVTWSYLKACVNISRLGCISRLYLNGGGFTMATALDAMFTSALSS